MLAGLRRNGQLAYTTRSGQMEKITVGNSPWVAGLPDIGSHRYPASWVEDRHSWLDQGVPLNPRWEEVLTEQELKQEVKEEGGRKQGRREVPGVRPP